MPPKLRVIATTPVDAEEDVPGSPTALFRRFSPYVAAVATRVLGDPVDVDDVVQEVFVDALPRLHTLRNASSIRAWLSTITVRHCVRRLRRRRWRMALGLESARSYEDLPDPSLSGEERATLALVYKRLDGISARARAAWTLFHVQDMPLKEISEACGCSLATTKRHIAMVNQVVEEAITHG